MRKMNIRTLRVVRLKQKMNNLLGLLAFVNFKVQSHLRYVQHSACAHV